jgi:4-hydroxyacetophenone monooxygenase
VISSASRVGPRTGFDRDEARQALANANLPALVMALYQISGDSAWLSEPYRPTRARGMDEHDAGGFADDVQQSIREAAVDLVEQWHSGRPAVYPHPSGELLDAMIDAFMGETLPPDFSGMMSGLFDPDDNHTTPADTRLDGFTVAIIGSGISGLCAALMLRHAGIAFTVFEENLEVGGTWWNNRYPGAGVDTPSFLYEFSFFPRSWSRHFSPQEEVSAYLRDVAEHFELRQNIRFGTCVESASYSESTQRWQLSVRDGTRTDLLDFNAVISAVGFLNRPRIPDLPGMREFGGPIFHSASWPADLDVRGKRVAVVGSGASAMQIVSAIAQEAKTLTVYQRTPQWIAPDPKPEQTVPSEMHWLLANVPFYQEWYRIRLAWNFNDKAYPALQIDPDWPDKSRSVNRINDRQREFFTNYLIEQLGDRQDLLEKSLPDYPPFGKRLLLDHGWFAAITRPNVELVTEAVVGFTEDGVQDSNDEVRAVDVVVLCTGFQTQRYVYPLEIVGRSATSLRDVWGDDDARAYLGITVPGFPNLFVMYGPNTNPGGGSYISVAESQARYVTSLLSQMCDDRLASIECREDRHDEYNAVVDDTHSRMVWSHPGMTTYFRNQGGRVVTNMPWRQLEYWKLTSEPTLDDFVVKSMPVADARDVVSI